MDVPDLDAPVIHANGDALPVQMVSDSSDDSDSEEEDSTDSSQQQKVHLNLHRCLNDKVSLLGQCYHI